MNEFYYAADIGNYLFKDSVGNLISSKVTDIMPYNSVADAIKINGVTYYIGEGEYEIQAKKFDKSSYLPLLLAGICKSTNEENVIVKLALGLPLNQIKKCSDELIELLEETQHNVIFNGRPRLIQITTVNVYPEGISAYQHLSNQYQIDLVDRDVVVVDIGGGTTDICLIRDYTATKLTSLNIGTIHIYDAIKKSLEQHYIDVKIDLEKVRHYLNKGFWYEGEEQDISFAIESAEYLFKKIYNELKLNYPISTEVVMLIGGGSELLEDAFEEAVSDLIVADDLFANVNGYLEMLMDE